MTNPSTHISTPKHVAIIMDGNRRWAKKHGLPAVMGHKKVAEERLEELIKYAAHKGITHLTLWVFSTENWQRKSSEVNALMDLFRWALNKKANDVIRKGVKIKCLGDLASFPQDIQTDFNRVIQASATNTKITVNLALNYGGRDELLRAFRLLAQQLVQQEITESDITAETISQSLYTHDTPDVDLIIRTSGEQRLSGFMPWQSVYSELYFTDTLMPDFDAIEFQKALDNYSTRHRRFGC